MTIFIWITTICWVVLIGFWVVAALGAKPSVGGGTRLWREAGVRVMLLVVVLVLWHLGLLKRTPTHLYSLYAVSAPWGLALGIVGSICSLAGVALAIWARIYLGKNWGMPMTLRQDHHLVTSGPYAWIRHPIYTGFLLAMLGSALTDDLAWLAVLLIFGVYFIYSARSEEKNHAPAISRPVLLLPKKDKNADPVYFVI